MVVGISYKISSIPRVTTAVDIYAMSEEPTPTEAVVPDEEFFGDVDFADPFEDLVNPLEVLHGQLLHVAIERKEFGELVKCGFSISMLSSPALAKIFTWIRRFNDTHKEVPSRRRLGGQFSNLTYIETDRPASIVLEDYLQARELIELGEAVDGAHNMTKLIGKDENADGELCQPRHVWEYMTDCVAKHRTYSLSQGGGGRPTRLAETMDLVRDYQDIKDGENLGIPLPFAEINNEIRGMMAGHLYGFFARPGHKKTWVILRACLHAAKLGYTVVFYSPEMLTIDTRRRLAAMAMEIDFNGIVHASLSEGLEKSYIKGLADLQNDESAQRLWILEPAAIRDIPTLQQVSMELKADLVVIDSVADLKPDIKGSNADMIRALMSQTKTLATTLEVPILFAHHQNRLGGRGMTGVAQGDAFNEACSFMWSLRKSDNTHIHIKPFKGREAELSTDYRYWFDVIEHKYDLETQGNATATTQEPSASKQYNRLAKIAKNV